MLIDLFHHDKLQSYTKSLISKELFYVRSDIIHNYAYMQITFPVTFQSAEALDVGVAPGQSLRLHGAEEAEPCLFSILFPRMWASHLLN